MFKKLNKAIAIALVGITALGVLPPTTTLASTVEEYGVNVELGTVSKSKSTVNLYKMENVKDSNGTGDYLLEVKLGDGWKPYERIEMTGNRFTFCIAYHKGYELGNSTNTYVWENTKGCILEDDGNLGSIILGKTTNPVNGVLEIPMHVCEEHRSESVYGKDAGFSILVKSTGGMVYENFKFKEALPISERDSNPTGGEQGQGKAKEAVEFTVGKGTYMLRNIGGIKGQDRQKSMQQGEKTYMSNGRTMVPVRYAGEALGCEINWNPAVREVVVKTTDGNAYRLPLNSQYAYDKQNNKYDLGAPTVQKNGRTYVAVGALGRILNCDVSWNSATNTATFTKK